MQQIHQLWSSEQEEEGRGYGAEVSPQHSDLQVPDQHSPGDVADKPTPHPGQVLGLECKEASEDPTVDFVKTSNGGGVSYI